MEHVVDFSHIFNDRRAADQTVGCHWSTAAEEDMWTVVFFVKLWLLLLFCPELFEWISVHMINSTTNVCW